MFRHLVDGDGESAAATRAFYDEYATVMDLPADFYLQTVDRVFQRQDLAHGRFRVRGALVDPGAIEHTALMTVEGERDDICGVGQTAAAHALCRNLAPDHDWTPVQVEVRLDRGLRLSRADEVGGGPPAEQDVHRVRDNRLARARLAGQRGEPRGEIHVHGLDDRQVPNADRAQHVSDGTPIVSYV